MNSSILSTQTQAWIRSSFTDAFDQAYSNTSLLIKADKYQVENPYLTLMWNYIVLLFSDLSLKKVLKSMLTPCLAILSNDLLLSWFDRLPLNQTLDNYKYLKGICDFEQIKGSFTMTEYSTSGEWAPYTCRWGVA